MTRPFTPDQLADPRPEPIYCRANDVPHRFGISRATLYRWAKKGGVSLHHHGGITLVKISDLSAYIEKKSA